jgi:hypothetical protein
MLISPKQPNCVWVRHGNGEAIGPRKENVSSRRFNTARGRMVPPSRVRHLFRISASREHRHRISALDLSTWLNAAPINLNDEHTPWLLDFPDHFFSREFGFRFGRKIIRGHEAGCRPAQDETAGLPIRGYGCAPTPRPPLVSDNRKLR